MRPVHIRALCMCLSYAAMPTHRALALFILSRKTAESLCTVMTRVLHLWSLFGRMQPLVTSE